MSSYSIANESIASEELKKLYCKAKSKCDDPKFKWDDLDLIFNIACVHRDRFPGINIRGENLPTLYLERWVKNYYDATKNPPSLRTANPKSSCTDPAIKIIVKNTQSFSEEKATAEEAIHNLFMSAENIQGNLLEEYISINSRPYGFLWCNGNVLRAIDFCNTSGTLLLQIKNKSNTENSSSSNIREGTTIKKWYRLGTRTRKGKKVPDYRWETLNEIINKYKTEGYSLSPCKLTEKEYQAFLTQKASANHKLITDK